MAINVMSWVWRESSAKGADLTVLLAIADAAHDDGDGAWPSVFTLSKKARVSERTVQRCLHSLAGLGELEIKKGAGRNGVNVYRVIMATKCHPADLAQGVTSSAGGATSTPSRGDMGVTQSVLDPSRTKSARTPFCDEHQPSGTEADCRKCGRRRIAFDLAKKNAPAEEVTRKAEQIQRRVDCLDCDIDGWILDAESKPLHRCLHRIPLPELDMFASAR